MSEVALCLVLFADFVSRYILTRFYSSTASPVVGFVRTTIKPVKKVDISKFLSDKATQWLENINARRLSDVDDLIAVDAVYHVRLG